MTPTFRGLAILAGTLSLPACRSEPAPPDAAAEEPAPAPAAEAPRPSRPWSPTGYALNGTEPFWGGTLIGGNLRYMVPEDQFGDVIAVTASYGASEEVYSGSYDDRPFVLTLTRGPCSNGMSDHRYAFTARLQVKGETRRGCADPQ